MYNDYINNLELLDELLEEASKSNDDFFSIDGFLIKKKMQFTHNKETFDIAEKLYNDDLVERYGDSSGMEVVITPKGREFVANGGYLKQKANTEEKENRDIELKDTTIKANNFNIKSYKWNRIFTVINTIILIINLILTYFNFIKK